MWPTQRVASFRNAFLKDENAWFPSKKNASPIAGQRLHPRQVAPPAVETLRNALSTTLPTTVQSRADRGKRCSGISASNMSKRFGSQRGALVSMQAPREGPFAAKRISARISAEILGEKEFCRKFDSAKRCKLLQFTSWRLQKKKKKETFAELQAEVRMLRFASPVHGRRLFAYLRSGPALVTLFRLEKGPPDPVGGLLAERVRASRPRLRTGAGGNPAARSRFSSGDGVPAPPSATRANAWPVQRGAGSTAVGAPPCSCGRTCAVQSGKERRLHDPRV